MKVCIVTWLGTGNFGTSLQSYALHMKLSEMGYNVSILHCFTPDDFSFRGRIYKWLRLNRILFSQIIKGEYFSKKQKKIRQFNKKNYCHQIIKTYRQYRCLLQETQIFITGSDQIWNFDCIKKMGYYYYLDWVTSLNVRKISYAVSFGKDAFELSDEVKKKVTGCLKGFSSISVREKSGIDICQNMLGLKADYDLDPTLLLSADDYNSIVKLDMRKRKKILCSFILDQSEEKKTYVKTIAAKLGLEVVNIYPEDVNRWKAMVSSKYGFLPVEKWLKYIYNADFVVTDSFHGVAFSINFNKQFVEINNNERGSTRFVNLLTLLNIKDRLIDNFDLNCIERKINYAEVNRLLALEKECSYYRLLNMIKY